MPYSPFPLQKQDRPRSPSPHRPLQLRISLLSQPQWLPELNPSRRRIPQHLRPAPPRFPQCFPKNDVIEVAQMSEWWQSVTCTTNVMRHPRVGSVEVTKQVLDKYFYPSQKNKATGRSLTTRHGKHTETPISKSSSTVVLTPPRIAPTSSSERATGAAAPSNGGSSRICQE